MGHILILYDSATGNIRQMAEHVASGAKSQNHDIRLKSIQQADKDDIIWCDGIAVGSPTNMGIVSWKMKKFWDELGDELWGKIDGKIGCAFSSSGGWGGGAEITCQSILTILINYGFLVFGVTDYVDKKMTLHYGSVVAGKPQSESERKSGNRLGKRLADWVSLLEK
ncbi:MAG: flavodoxin family protein [Candidatus Marinimicrobia bacterium]|nr:flavodoxin family protein [Candidatus Neomarinimicrobiota bacterium]